MAWPDWIEDNKWRWIIGTFIAIIIPVVLHILNRNKKSTQSLNINGNNNIPVQINQSPGTTVSINKIDTEELVKKLAEQLKYKRLEEKEAEIQELKERLRQETTNEFKQTALQALDEGDTKKATELLEKSARSRAGQAEQLTRQAAQDWIDIGNIAFIHDSQKALSAYKQAIKLDAFNTDAWNGLGHIQERLGQLDEAQQAYEQVHKLAGEDKSIQAIAYGNLGNIYQIRGELDKAEEFHTKSLEIEKALGRQEGMADQYGNLGNIYGIRGELDKAEKFQLKSLEINKALGRQEGMAIAYVNLGNIYQTRGELDKACGYWQKSLQLFSKIGAKNETTRIQGLIDEKCK